MGLAGCASVNSTRQGSGSEASPKNGISYFLPKGRVEVGVAWNPASRTWDVSPTVVYEADPRERFDLDWSNSILSDKDTTVAVDPGTGLLQSINAGYPGQNVNTVGTLIGASPNVIRLGTMTAAVRSHDSGGFGSGDFDAFAGHRPGGIAPGPSTYAASSLIIVDDADRSSEVALVASPLSGNGGPPRVYAAIKVTLVKKFDLGAEFPRHKKWAVPADGKGGGIAVRLPLPYELSVEEVISSDPTFKDSSQPKVACGIAPRIVMLPDSKHDFIYRILSRPLVSDATKVSLANGMIQSLEQTRPGMLAALLQIPKYFVTNLIPIPVEITQTQQNVSNAESKIATGQTAGSTATEDK